MNVINNIETKAQILSYGLQISETALKSFSSPYLCKRRAYGNTDDIKFTYFDVPQEVVLFPQNLIAAVILKDNSPWMIDYIEGKYYLRRDGYENIEISFTITPGFYGLTTKGGVKVENVLTLIFGHTLGVFMNTNCYFATPERHCRYCSINSNSARPKDILRQLDLSTTLEAIEMAIQNDDNMVDSIFISGGNFNGFNENFLFYSKLALSAQKIVERYGRQIEVMLNVFPPEDISLIDNLKNSNINVLVSTEVFDEKNFQKYCPGKSKFLTKERLYPILRRYVEILGKNHVYSIVIQGLESEESLISGIRTYAELGVCTVVNVLHLDPGTELYDMNIKPPDPDSIIRIARETSKVYAEFGFRSERVYGGRSSFDKEASLQLLG